MKEAVRVKIFLKMIFVFILNRNPGPVDSEKFMFSLWTLCEMVFALTSHESRVTDFPRLNQPLPLRIQSQIYPVIDPNLFVDVVQVDFYRPLP